MLILSRKEARQKKCHDRIAMHYVLTNCDADQCMWWHDCDIAECNLESKCNMQNNTTHCAECEDRLGYCNYPSTQFRLLTEKERNQVLAPFVVTQQEIASTIL